MLSSKLVFSHLELKGMQGNFWKWLSSSPFTYFKWKTCISNSKIWGTWMGNGWVRNSLWISNSSSWFQIWPFFSFSYEFKINLELNQILNSTTGDWVWVLKHVETSSQCLHPIQNASYSFRTHNFWRFLGCLWLFFVISGQ